MPSLSAIEAFLAVAETGSVKEAADRLALSSPALSRRLQAFERTIGHPLFERAHKAMILTDAGQVLIAQLSPIMTQLGDVLARASSTSGAMRLHLGVPPLFAAQQLLPRLVNLRTLHPELHLDLDTAPHAAHRLGATLDAAIVLVTRPETGLYSHRLDRNLLRPCAVRDYLRPGGLTDPRQLVDATILVHRDLPDTFEAWVSALGVPDLKPAAIDLYDSGQLILDAAAQGLGIALLHESHFDAAADDRLVPVFNARVESPYSYWFVCRPRALEQRPVRLFHDWLMTERF